MCFKCSTGKYEVIHSGLLVSERKWCTTECPLGQYADIKTFQCGLCHSSCESCSGPLSNDCGSCKAGFYAIELDTGSKTC